MKTNVIIRVVCWSVVAALLLAILAVGLGAGRGWGIHFPWFQINISGESGFEGVEATGPVQLEASQVQRITVDWVNGSVTIRPHAGSTVQFEQTAQTSIPEKYRLRYELLADGTLRIRLGRPNHFWGVTPVRTDLALELPESLALELLSVDTASASITAQGVSAQELRLESTSGKVEAADLSTPVLRVETTSGAIRLSRVSAGTLRLEGTSGAIRGEEVSAPQADVETVSGGIDLAGAFGDLDCETVSGRLKVESTAAPSRVDLDSVSGAIVLRVPDNPGFTARIETVSGSTSVDFPVTLRGSASVYGDGSADYALETVSGSITVERLAD